MQNEYYVQLQFAIDMAYRLLEYDDTRVGYVAFSNIPYLVHPLTSDRDSLIDAMNNRAYYPSLPTNLHVGIGMAHQHFTTDGRADVEHIMVILSDGYTPWIFNLITNANSAKSDGIRIAAVSVTSNPSLTNLKKVISHPFSKYLFVANNFVDLMKLEYAVMKLICGESKQPLLRKHSFNRLFI
jgi:hypothetical protein